MSVDRRVVWIVGSSSNCSCAVSVVVEVFITKVCLLVVSAVRQPARVVTCSRCTRLNVGLSVGTDHQGVGVVQVESVSSTFTWSTMHISFR